MTPREQGYLLLTGLLGDPNRKPLSVVQLRELALRAKTMKKPLQNRDIACEDLTAMGCSPDFARKVISLLSQQEQLVRYLREGARNGCCPITRINSAYPERLRRVLGVDAPGALWAKGDVNLLQTPMIALVGSRDLRQENYRFACEVGRQAARQGFTLVSGNARGADRAAQDSCLEHGGNVISVVADALKDHTVRENMLYLSETGFDIAFSAQRALQRNRIIHVLGQKVFIAQCRKGKGGTWSGTALNLRKNWSPVFCCDDGSEAADELQQMGASLVKIEALGDMQALRSDHMRFMDG